MSTDRFLVLSAGNIGRRHLQNLRALRPSARIAVLRRPSSVTQPLPPHADLQFSSLEEAIAFAPRAAVVCSPASRHAAHAASLVRHGIPVLIEKPIGDSPRAIREMLADARARNTAVMTAYNFRFHPALRAVKRLLQEGAIGAVLGARAEVGQYLPDWRPASRYQETVSAQRALGGGVLLELSHEIDYLYWLFGLPRRVMAMGARYSSLEIDVEDMAQISLEYREPSRLVSVHLDFLQRSPSRTCKFIGTDGTLVWDGIVGSLAVFRAGGSWERVAIPAHERNQMYVDELQHFLSVVEGREECLVDGRQGLDVLDIVDAARRSMETGHAIDMKSHEA